VLINAAKRAEVIPTSAFTQLIALAEILALALVTALYLAFGRRTGTFGLVAFLLNAFALSALIGVEFVINLVFSDLPDNTVEVLLNGSLGIALTSASSYSSSAPLRSSPHAPHPRAPHGATRPVRRRRHTDLAASLRARGGAGPRTRHPCRGNRLARDLALRPLQPHRPTWKMTGTPSADSVN
jgi:hypothetical protein